MSLIPKSYLSVLKNRDFFLLTSIIFVGQLASSFLMLALVVSVFSKTGSNFGVSGVIVSFTLPGFLLMAVAGLTADIFDRRKIIILANLIIALVVLLIVFSIDAVYATIPLSFLYFAGNAFFIPASSAASAQLVRKSKLLIANAIFIFTLSAGTILGLFIAALIHFFFGYRMTLIICEILLLVAVLLSAILPRLVPHRIKDHSILKILADIWKAFIYIFNQKIIWFFFLIFAFMQAIVAFGVTLAPGFFNDIVGLSINKSPIFIMPLVGLGIVAGVALIHNLKVRESLPVILGVGVIGASSLILGLILKFDWVIGRLLLIPIAIYLVILGFGAICSMIASRTVIQKKVFHNYQGTVFGANIILSSFLAGVMAPSAAGIEILLGYVNLLVFVGIGFLALSAIFSFLSSKWKY